MLNILLRILCILERFDNLLHSRAPERIFCCTQGGDVEHFEHLYL
jgi:hypothetical protein